MAARHAGGGRPGKPSRGGKGRDGTGRYEGSGASRPSGSGRFAGKSSGKGSGAVRPGGKARAGKATGAGKQAGVRRLTKAEREERDRARAAAAKPTGKAFRPRPHDDDLPNEPLPRATRKGISLADADAERADAEARDSANSAGGDDTDEDQHTGSSDGSRASLPRPGVRNSTSPWWKDGLRFECTACGRCCSNHGEFAYVFSTRAERKAIAERLGLSLRAFEERYTERVDGDGGRTFTSRDDACVFLDERGQCSIYEQRPKQCRTFPFWPELLADEDSWQRDVASFCPGAGQGTLHDADTIRERLSEYEP